MSNKIKYINTYALLDYLCSYKSDKEIEEIEETVYNMEQSQEFKNLFFFSENEDIYLYQEGNEQKIKDFISNKIDISNMNDTNVFDYYGNYLFDYGYIKLGEITIEEEDLYRTLRDKYLTDDKCIERLVSAGENFHSELDKIKRECLEYMINLVIAEIKVNLEKFKF